MHDYNTILGVIELRLSKVSYDTVQKRYRIGRSGITLIMKRYNDSGLSLDDLRQMPTSKVVDLIYPKENLRHKDIPLPDFEKIHEQMVQMGKHADLSFLWIDYKKEHPNGYQLASNASKPVDIFSELEKHLAILFENQADNRVYDSLMSDIETLANEARKFPEIQKEP